MIIRTIDRLVLWLQSPFGSLVATLAATYLSIALSREHLIVECGVSWSHWLTVWCIG